jgi:hypothetical protein
MSVQQAPEDAVSTLSKWFTSCCSLLPRDSTTLAHSLVTLKYITSVDALYDVLQSSPEFLTLELKQPLAYSLQVNSALTKYKNNSFLTELKKEQVCDLLGRHGLSSIKPVVIEHEISGKTFLYASLFA